MYEHVRMCKHQQQFFLAYDFHLIFFLSRPQSPDAVFRLWVWDSIPGNATGNDALSLYSGAVCPPELLEVGPQAGTVSRSAVRGLPPLLHQFREAVEYTHTHSSRAVIQKDTQTRFPLSPLTTILTVAVWETAQWQQLPESCIDNLW